MYTIFRIFWLLYLAIRYWFFRWAFLLGGLNKFCCCPTSTAVHCFAPTTGTPVCFSRLGACWPSSTVGDTLTMDKYLIQPYFKTRQTILLMLKNSVNLLHRADNISKQPPRLASCFDPNVAKLRPAPFSNWASVRKVDKHKEKSHMWNNHSCFNIKRKQCWCRTPSLLVKAG